MKILFWMLALVVAAQAGTVGLTWTAPGDDGTVGTAAEYDIRHSQDSTVVADWDNAVQVVDEPVPDTAGTTQYHVVTGLVEGKWYFAIKARDEAMNWSPLSNIHSIVIDQTAPTAIINLGGSQQ